MKEEVLTVKEKRVMKNAGKAILLFLVINTALLVGIPLLLLIIGGVLSLLQ